MAITGRVGREVIPGDRLTDRDQSFRAKDVLVPEDAANRYDRHTNVVRGERPERDARGAGLQRGKGRVAVAQTLRKDPDRRATRQRLMDRAEHLLVAADL